jgi:hypothetical protein
MVASDVIKSQAIPAGMAYTSLLKNSWLFEIEYCNGISTRVSTNHPVIGRTEDLVRGGQNCSTSKISR